MTAVGIDLGTTNSCAAIWRVDRVEAIRDLEGDVVTPSVVSARPSGEWLAGPRARRDFAAYPDHCYRWVKRLMGRAFDDPQVALQQAAASYAIAAADNGEAWIVGREQLHAPAQIASHILRRLKASAEVAIGKGVTRAVITVPAYFNNAQRAATLEAGQIAGLEVLRIINEPTAAGLALELDRSDEPQTVAVYDLGGGTFDLSVLRTDADGHIEVVVSNGDTFLGGEDFDRCLVDYLAGLFEAEHGADPRADVLARARLKEAAEGAKIALSFQEETEVVLETFMLLGAERRPVDFRVMLERATLERLTGDLVARTLDCCRAALAEAELDVDAIDRVILVGGQTRAPAVQAAVRGLFARSRIEQPDPDQLVARGAAILAAALTGQMAVDLEDVTPFAIGVETADGAMVTLIEAQAKIPSTRTVAFTVATPETDGATVRLRQGNSDDPRENLPLGRFDIDGVVADRGGRKIVDVTVDIDADGVMTGAARDRGSGRTASLKVDTMGLSPRAIERMSKATARAARHVKKEAADGVA